jgi:hypothetical protein
VLPEMYSAFDEIKQLSDEEKGKLAILVFDVLDGLAKILASEE